MSKKRYYVYVVLEEAHKEKCNLGHKHDVPAKVLGARSTRLKAEVLALRKSFDKDYTAGYMCILKQEV